MSGAPDLATVRHLVSARPALGPAFAAAAPAIARSDAAFERDWAAATLELSAVNAGIACIQAFWRLDPPDPSAGIAAAAICRHAGAAAAGSCLSVLPEVRRLLGAADVPSWWTAMRRLAEAAPEQVRPVTARLPVLLADNDVAGFADFVGAALKATVRDKRRRTAIFAGTDPLAATLLARRPGARSFADCQPMLDAFVTGLWGEAPRLQAMPPNRSDRTVISAGTILLPASFPGGTGALYRAAAAHARAHLAVPSPNFAVASLRPIQRVLVGVLEDARVEALAIARFPGLRSLWAPWHVAEPGGPALAPNLLARLARALLDPDFPDTDAFVAKGRALFAAADRHDPATSRIIGGLLGNDLGQMRVPFNAKTFVIEPTYRDDNMHLWDLPETRDDSLALSVETSRERPNEAPSPRARPAGQNDRPDILATYPEWDSASATLRPDWTTVRDAVPRRRPVTDPPDARLRHGLTRLVRSLAVGQRTRRPPAEEGEDLDTDRLIAAASARRMGTYPDPRLYVSRSPLRHDLSTIVILDTSQSTASAASPGSTVLDVQRRAAAALAEAMETSGKALALRSFASAGRDDVRLTRLKDFDEKLSPAVHERLAGLRAGLSTRLGAALRHVGTEFATVTTTRKLVLVFTDGEPSDIDVADPSELTEDARHAARELRRRGIDVVGLLLQPPTARMRFDIGISLVLRHPDELLGSLTKLLNHIARR